ncbi:MAG TPA: hypothetical protein PLQ55_04535 [Bacilli bacterium]|nr:hypothetical protein [Bacilli bacterium]
MDIKISTLEISASAVKLVVGYELEGSPYVLYANKVALSQAISAGEIVAPDQVINAIKVLAADAREALGETISEVVLALPTIDFEVFRGNKRQTRFRIKLIGLILKISWHFSVKTVLIQIK